MPSHNIRRLNTLFVASAFAEIPLASGRFRILSVLATFAALTVAENVNLIMTANDGNRVRCPTGPSTVVGAIASWFLGASLSQPLALSFNPATGVYTFQAASPITGPLPDIIWESSVELTVTANSGLTCSALDVLYELWPESVLPIR